MRKCFLFISIFVVSLLGSAHDFATDRVVEDGPYKKYFDNGQLKETGEYKNKIRVGDWKSYYESGELLSLYSYTKGKRDEIYKSFYKNGIIKTETKIIDGVLVTKSFYENGDIFFERLFKDGYYKEYYENGVLKIESNYIDNQLFGIWRQFYNSGEIEWEVTFKEDYKDGYFKQFYKNGKLKVEGNYKKNKKEGEEKHYFENGQLETLGYYNDDYRTKKWILYNEKGDIVDQMKFKKGEIVNSIISEIIVPDGILEQVPLFPGCENELNNKAQSNCLSKNISMFIAKKFNTQLALALGLNGRQHIYVVFKINKMGKVVEARSRAPHPDLEKEAIRVVNLLPRMIAGKQRGKAIDVPYSLPIVFQVQK